LKEEFKDEELKKKQFDMTQNLKRTSELIENYIKTNINDLCKLRLDPNNGYKQLNSMVINYKQNLAEFNNKNLLKYIELIHNKDEYKNNPILQLINKELLDEINSKIIQSDEELYEELNNYANNYLIDQTILMIKTYSLNKISN